MPKKIDIFNVIFREKPASMLIFLLNRAGKTGPRDKGVYASSLAKQVDCTYSHVVKILQAMEKAGLILFEKKGRLKLITLTRKGRDFSEHLDAAHHLLQR